MVKRRGHPARHGGPSRVTTRGYCRHGSVRCSNCRFRPALCLRLVRLDRRDFIWITVTENLTAASAIGTGSMAASTRADCAPWASGTSLPSASPWQNNFAERLIGSIRRECLDHMIVLGEVHSSDLSTAAISFDIAKLFRANGCLPVNRRSSIGSYLTYDNGSTANAGIGALCSIDV
jgi:hypothetical protein